MTEHEQIAAFIASRGVTKIEAGATTLDEHTLNKAYRADRRAASRSHDPIRQRRVVYDHAGRQHVQNGLGEWIA